MKAISLDEFKAAVEGLDPTKKSDARKIERLATKVLNTRGYIGKHCSPDSIKATSLCSLCDQVSHDHLENGMIIARYSRDDGHVCCVQWYTGQTEKEATFRIQFNVQQDLRDLLTDEEPQCGTTDNC